MFEQLLGGAGGAGAGSYLGRQGRGPGVMDLLAPLDFPRQALANLGRGIYRGVSGDATWEDLLGALPGAAGLVGGALTGGVGGVLAGSLMGGALQGGGRLTGREAFNAPETSELLSQLGGDPESMIQNLALGAATDPLTYAGIGPGARAGSALKGPLARFHGNQAGSIGVPASLFGEAAEAGSAERKLLAGMVDREGRPLSYLPTSPRGGPDMGLPVLEHGTALRPGDPLPRLGQGYERAALSPSQQTTLSSELQALEGGRMGSPLSGVKETFPANMTAQEYNERLNSLYGVARDFEGDLAAGGLGIPPAEALKQRHLLWDDILRAEQGFQNRASPNSFMVKAPEVYDQVNPMAHWRPPERTFTPDIAQQLIDRQAQARGEQNIAQFFTDPQFQELARQGSGGHYEQGKAATRSLYELINESGGIGMPNAIHDAAYFKYDQPTFMLQSGQMPPEQAQSVLSNLLAKGYPIDQQRLMAHYQGANQLAQAQVPDLVRDLANSFRSVHPAGSGGLDYSGTDAIERLTRLLGPTEADRLIQQARAMAAGGI